jgi:hypothetical protein
MSKSLPSVQQKESFKPVVDTQLNSHHSPSTYKVSGKKVCSTLVPFF